MEDYVKGLDYSEDSVDGVLKFDPLAEAENMTGRSYKEDKLTMELGMLAHIDHTRKKNSLLSSMDDTHYGTSLTDYERIITDIGFVEVFREEFVNREGNQEYQSIRWMEKYGILLSYDTFGWAGKPHLNGGKYYYNWIPNGQAKYGHVLSSGCYKDRGDGVLVWGGDHDCREAIRHNIAALAEAGTFVIPWEHMTSVSVNTYNDYDLYRKTIDRDTQKGYYTTSELSIGRLNKLPEEVKEKIIIPENTWAKYIK